MPEIGGQAFNIGGAPARSASLIEVLEILRALNGRLPQVTYGDWRTGDQKYYTSDTRKFCRTSGWTPRYTVADGVKNLHDWLIQNMMIPVRPAAGRFKWDTFTSSGAEAI